MAEENKVRMTDEEIDTLYREERNRVTKKMFTIVIGIIVAYVGMILLLGLYSLFRRFFRFQSMFMMPIGLLICTILCYAFKGKIREKLSFRITRPKNVLYDIVIPYCVEDMFGPDAKFNRDGGCNEGFLKTKEILGFSCEYCSTRDMVEGTCNGLNFMMVDVELYDEHTYTDSKGNKRTERKTAFEGPWAVIDFNNKKINNNIIVRERNEKSRLKHDDEKLLVQMENVGFNNKFFVLSDDPHSVFYLLTPPMMEHLMDAEKKFNGWIYFGFIDGKIYIGIHKGMSTFGSVSLGRGVANVRPEIYEKLSLVPGLIEKLELL